MENNIKEGKEILKEHWHTPKEINLPKNINTYLSNLIESHLQETNKKFNKELTNNEHKKEEFWAIGEFMFLNGELSLFVKARKMGEEGI